MGLDDSILLLGGSGQLGTALLELWGGRPAAVHAPPRAEFDLEDATAATRAVERYGARTVVNAAAFNDVAAAQSGDGLERSRRLNVALPARLAEACASRGARLVHVSTDYVFDGRKRAPYLESDPPDPLQAYGRAKLDGEAAVLERCPVALVVRTSTVFGPSARGSSNFVLGVLGRARGVGRVEMVTGPRSSPTHAPDLARAIDALLAAGARGRFHVANSGDCTRFEFAGAILEVAGLAATTELVRRPHAPDAVPRPGYSVLDTGALTARTGMRPRPWREALAEYVAGLDAEGGRP